MSDITFVEDEVTTRVAFVIRKLDGNTGPLYLAVDGNIMQQVWHYAWHKAIPFTSYEKAETTVKGLEPGVYEIRKLFNNQ